MGPPKPIRCIEPGCHSGLIAERYGRPTETSDYHGPVRPSCGDSYQEWYDMHRKVSELSINTTS